MRGKKIVFTIFGFLLIGGFIFTLLSSYNIKPVEADSLCPSYMNPDSLQCLNYLEKQRAQIESQTTKAQKQLKDIEYQKLSLEEKIEYTGNLIAQMENDIKKLQLEISATDIEINMLEKDIKGKEDDISTLKQEIIVLSDTVSERVTESYKYSFLDSIAVFLDFQNAPAILRRIKYLEITREQDKAVLGEHTEKTSILEKEEERLSETKEELQEKRNLVENERVELGEQKLSLDAQKRERESLLAQAKAKERQLLAEMAQNKTLQSKLDAQIAVLRNQNIGDMVEEGPVGRGNLIGTLDKGRGYCGFSTGPHLHFGISKTATGQGFYANVPVWENGYLTWGGYGPVKEWDGKFPQPASSGSYLMPLTGSVVVTQNYHEGDSNNYYAVDMVRADFYSTGGAQVVAAAAGTLYRNKETVCTQWSGGVCKAKKDCGQDYVIIDHHNGLRTIYVHLARK